MSSFKDLTGEVHGLLTVRCLHSRSRNGHVKWLCDCSCGNTHVVYSTHLVSGKITHCGCNPYRGKQHKAWTGCGDISGNFWSNVVRGANGSKGRKPIELSITIEYAWDLFLKQDKRCALSGMPLWFRNTSTMQNSQTASLDRIDSSLGYVEGNVQWVHKDVNKMKNSFNQEYFLSLCRSIVNA